MSREQSTSPQRQFMHPISLIQDPKPVEDQDNASFTLNEPPWMRQYNKSDNATRQQGQYTSATFTQPQSKENLAGWQSWPYEAPSALKHDSPISWMVPPAPSHTAKKKRDNKALQQLPKRQTRQKSRKKRLPLWMAALSIIAIVAIVLTQGNGTVGAWTADAVRAIAGPVAAAQVEAWYLNAQNTAYKWEYQLGLQHVNTPLQARPKGIKLTRPAKTTLKPMSLLPLQALIAPKLDGEGTWNTLEAAPGTYSYLPLDATTFIRPDPATPYAVVSLLQFDARFMRLHIVSGTQEPGGPLGAYGTGIIPQADQKGNALLATLNGGFKYADGAFGLMADGRVYVPPQPNMATIAITKSGKLMIGTWGTDPQLNSNNKDLVAWRQNAALLINNGEINTLAKDGAAWGGTILNSEYTWRSGLGITAQGNLLYAAGNALLPETLGEALKAAGAVMAMETDINPFWTRAFLYQQQKNGALNISKLNPNMQGTGYEYLTGDQRDFFYLTRYTPKPSDRLTSTQ